MNDDDKKQVQQIAELEVRRYFDTYLRDIYPMQTKQILELHDKDENAHAGMPRRFNRLVWMLLGVATAGGGIGGTVAAILRAAVANTSN